ncbi:MAG: choice-of-anchor tandem repeat GloVer-containing protein [Candidatus Tumulicola sp.]
MNSVNLRRYALSTAALALLAACGGSQPPIQATQAFAHRIPATQNYEVLYSFGNGADGANPAAALVALSNGSGCCFYGTTQYGGKYNKGTVFGYGAAGEAVLHSFGAGSDGVSPQSGLVEVNGALYGTTPYGGKNGDGTVFSVNPTTGAETVLLDFNGHDGALPFSGLLDVSGTLYGTTYEGGDGNRGVVYGITTSGTQKVVYSFHGRPHGGNPDGASPIGGLISMDGLLYGTTDQGGNSGDGTVFSLNPATGVETVLHAFDGSDGANPWVGLLDVSGTLYGTAQGGGTNGDGTIFKLIPPTKVRPIAFAVVHDFVAAEGARPRAPLVNFDNELYGTTSFGGASDKGAMYNISLQGALGETHSFAGGPGDGSQPWAGVLLMDGTLYGTTLKGGLYRKGAIFLCEFC